MSTLAIVISLAGLMFLAYRGISVLLLAPLMAAVAVLLSGDLGHMLPLYTSTFMGALGNYMLQFFPVFLLGALFGQLMADSGAATAISHWIMRVLGEKHAILTVVLACAVLTYGGVSLFVVAFAIYPIAKSLFRAAHVPKRLIPPTIALGSFTFTMTALPGTPSIQNAIPIPYYGTNVFAAPGLGIIGGMTMLALGLWWLQSRAAKARVAGEGYGDHDDAVEQGLHDESDPAPAQPPGPAAAAGPAAAGAGDRGQRAADLRRVPQMDFGFLKDRFPAVNPAKQTGLWALILSWPWPAPHWCCWAWAAGAISKESVNKGVLGSMLPIFNTARKWATAPSSRAWPALPSSARPCSTWRPTTR